MKRSYRAFFCLLALLVLSTGLLPSAAALFEQKLYYYGQVEEVETDDAGAVQSILVSSEQEEDYRMLLTPATRWEDYRQGTASDPATLAVGESICVVHSSAVMMSLPPQSTAYTVIRNFPEGTDLQQEARRAACPVTKFVKKAKKALADWFYQASPIQN